MTRIYSFFLFLAILGMVWLPEYRGQFLLSALLCMIFVFVVAVSSDDPPFVKVDEPETLYSSRGEADGSA
jgi:hypothetical protein